MQTTKKIQPNGKNKNTTIYNNPYEQKRQSNNDITKKLIEDIETETRQVILADYCYILALFIFVLISKEIWANEIEKFLNTQNIATRYVQTS